MADFLAMKRYAERDTAEKALAEEREAEEDASELEMEELQESVRREYNLNLVRGIVHGVLVNG